MAYPQRSSWGSFSNPEYSRLQDQIQQETMALLRERDQLEGHFNSNNDVAQQPILRPVESQKYIKLNSERSNSNVGNPKSLISEKVRELLDLCKK